MELLKGLRVYNVTNTCSVATISTVCRDFRSIACIVKVVEMKLLFSPRV